MISSLNLVSGQIENNNSSFKFPIDVNEKKSHLYKSLRKVNISMGFFKKDPIDMTDPNFDENAI